MSKGVIFDLDGVLVDTAEYHFKAWKALADEFGHDLTVDDNEAFKGVSRIACMDILCETKGIQLTDEEKRHYANKKNDRYLESIKNMDKNELLDGVQDALDSFKRRGFRIALGSASKNAKFIIGKTGIAHYFDAVVDGNSVSKAKPDPEVFLKAAEQIGCCSSECLVFEDAFAGVQAAINANMDVIGIGTAEALSNAPRVVKNLAEYLNAQ